MKIDTTTATRTIVTTTHATVVSIDELAALATVAAKSKAGVPADAAAVTSRNDDGSVAVTITVETDAPATTAEEAPSIASQPPGLMIPTHVN